MYKIEHVINAKATVVRDGRETELFVGDELTQDEFDTLKVYGDRLIYKVDWCTGEKEICGVSIEAHLPQPSTAGVTIPAVNYVEPPVTK